MKLRISDRLRQVICTLRDKVYTVSGEIASEILKKFFILSDNIRQGCAQGPERREQRDLNLQKSEQAQYYSSLLPAHADRRKNKCACFPE
jgi:hypothetical protein